MLQKIIISNFELQNGKQPTNINVFYEVFGQPVGTSPIVLVNHALTGNSNVAGKNGWWASSIGAGKTIDTNLYTIIAINIPGNGYDGFQENLIYNYKDYRIFDIATIFWKTLFTLEIKNVFAIIGGSLGGAIAWEMFKQEPNRIENLVPIATDWKATDWVIANVLLQDKILNNSINPIVDARIHAMMLYRTPESMSQKFKRSTQHNSNLFQVESWLTAHGKKLEDRFKLASYKLMNQLLKTHCIAQSLSDLETIVKNSTTKIHIIAVDSDAFFLAEEDQKTFSFLKSNINQISLTEIRSIHGHDAFLIEYKQLNNAFQRIFCLKKCSLTII